MRAERKVRRQLSCHAFTDITANSRPLVLSDNRTSSWLKRIYDVID